MSDRKVPASMTMVILPSSQFRSTRQVFEALREVGALVIGAEETSALLPGGFEISPTYKTWWEKFLYWLGFRKINQVFIGMRPSIEGQWADERGVRQTWVYGTGFNANTHILLSAFMMDD